VTGLSNTRVTPAEPQRTSERLEAVARKPFPRGDRELLLHLAERCRAIEAVDPNTIVWEDAM
jgi:hypothetical protein